MIIPSAAKCSVALLCAFENVIDNEEMVKERCSFCHRQVYYNKVNGRIDNKKFYEEHFRDFLQPYGGQKALYTEVYGTSNPKRAAEYLAKKKKISVDEIRAEIVDTLKTLRRTSFS